MASARQLKALLTLPIEGDEGRFFWQIRKLFVS